MWRGRGRARLEILDERRSRPIARRQGGRDGAGRVSACPFAF